MAAPLINASITNLSRLSVLLMVSALIPLGRGYARCAFESAPVFVLVPAALDAMGGVDVPFGSESDIASSTRRCCAGSDEGPDAAVGGAPGVGAMDGAVNATLGPFACVEDAAALADFDFEGILPLSPSGPAVMSRCWTGEVC